MATNTAGTTAREFDTQQTHYLRKSVAFNTTGIGSDATVKVGTLPVGAQVLRTSVAITTVFNAATTNVLIVGTAADPDALVAAGGVDETAVALTSVAPATLAGAVAPSADTAIYAKFTESGTPATTGAATIVVEYALNNDG